MIKQQNTTLEGRVVSKKRKVSSYGTFTIVNSYKLDVIFNQVDIFVLVERNKCLFPSIALMANVVLSTELTICFKEGVFLLFSMLVTNLRTCTLSHIEQKLWISKMNRYMYANFRKKTLL